MKKNTFEQATQQIESRAFNLKCIKQSQMAHTIV